MLQIQRHEQILKYLAQHDLLTVDNAIELFDASAPTVRRDFNTLADKKLAHRFRGGLRSFKQSPNQMMPFALRQLRQSAEKKALAYEAVKLLKPGCVIIIDGGTTTFHLGLCLPNIELRVITNSLSLAAMLEEKSEEHSNLEISLTGGLLYKKSGILLGPNTEAGISQYHADFAFLSVGGINECGIYNTNELVTGTQRAMIKHADQVVILADDSKIGKKAMCHVCGLEDIDILITNDGTANQQILSKLQDFQIHIIKAPIANGCGSRL